MNQPRHQEKQNRYPRKNRICYILALTFIILFCISTFMLIRQLWQENQEKNAFTDLSCLVSQQTVQSIEEENMPFETNETALLPQYATLYEKNSDFVGWLKIENTEINLPVMLTIDEPEYYLHRAFDKSSSQSGTPFIGMNGSTNSDCLIIYGHNMKNKTMFGTLDYYTDRDFWTKNKSLFFDTLYEKREYEVFAALETRILYENETGFRYYKSSGTLTEAQYNELRNWLIEQSNYDTGIVPTYGEQILMLSTCSYHTDNGRFVVAARRKKQ